MSTGVLHVFIVISDCYDKIAINGKIIQIGSEMFNDKNIQCNYRFQILLETDGNGSRLATDINICLCAHIKQKLRIPLQNQIIRKKKAFDMHTHGFKFIGRMKP